MTVRWEIPLIFLLHLASASKRVNTREGGRLFHQDGEVLSVIGRSAFANDTKMPMVLRMKHVVKSADHR